ncbi:uncharacterized protein N7482_003099 [Penicillium canariense]|uniref:RNase H type-1 domain-containing protein n=1 Tax=Penicillium canariense TaxID=189055 RepID=A0A9W9IJ07_9EURO|nr:uncharacterized protein N7482_003099 [Penicillium canariense]KAJ5177222.1 hypothetical protein N7482_003099 [Penicillium canariense]
MVVALKHLTAGLPHVYQSPTPTFIPEAPPAYQSNIQKIVKRSVSPSPFGVEDEGKGRYRRSASPSPEEPRHEEVQEVPLSAECNADHNARVTPMITISRKRKRSVGLTSNVFSPVRSDQDEARDFGRFKGIIVHRRFEEAKAFAMLMNQVQLKIETVYRHIFWTDGSIVNRSFAAGAVAWKQPATTGWNTEGFPYPRSIQNCEVVEMFAIAHALKRAVNEVKKFQIYTAQGPQLQLTHEVLVFTDSIGALVSISKDALGNHRNPYCEQAHVVIDYSIQLHKLGVHVELHLVPGHHKVPGNEQAHRAAYKAAKIVAVTSKFQNQHAVPPQGAEVDPAVLAPTLPSTIPAVPVTGPHLHKTCRTLSGPVTSPTPLVLIPPVSLKDDAKDEQRNGISLSPIDTQSACVGGVLGSSFTPVDASSVSSSIGNPLTGVSCSAPPQKFTISPPVSLSVATRAQKMVIPPDIQQTSANLSDPLAGVSSAQASVSVLSPMHWFTPINTRSAITEMVRTAAPTPANLELYAGDESRTEDGSDSAPYTSAPGPACAPESLSPTTFLYYNKRKANGFRNNEGLFSNQV